MRPELINGIKRLSVKAAYPDGDTYRSISTKDVSDLSSGHGVFGREIEIAALESDIVPERYARNMKMYSLEDQTALLRASVSIVGLGGLGGGVTEILARIGIGTLHLIDGDHFEDSNLNRQFLSGMNRLSVSKAQAAMERVGEINPSITVHHHREFLTEKTGDRLLGRPDVLVDCLDSLYTRLVLEKFAKKIKTPMVSAAVAGGSGHVTVIFPDDPGLKMIYGDKVDPSMKGAEASLGCLPQAVTLLSSIECSEVVKIILKKGTLSRNQLIVVDLLDNSFETLQLV
jgi:molybdopterin-synthase adenylyltransferase